MSRTIQLAVGLLVAALLFVAGAVVGRARVPEASGLPLRFEELQGPADVVTEGPFTFRVVAWRCGILAVAGDHADWLPQGQYCRVRVRMENTGPRTANYDTSLQQAVDRDGRAYPANINAIQISEQPTTMEVHGRAAYEFDIWFDVPESAEIVAVDFHSDPESQGARINLSQ